MFKFLKGKLKDAVKTIRKGVDEQAEDELVEEIIEDDQPQIVEQPKQEETKTEAESEVEPEIVDVKREEEVIVEKSSDAQKVTSTPEPQIESVVEESQLVEEKKESEAESVTAAPAEEISAEQSEVTDKPEEKLIDIQPSLNVEEEKSLEITKEEQVIEPTVEKTASVSEKNKDAPIEVEQPSVVEEEPEQSVTVEKPKSEPKKEKKSLFGKLTSAVTKKRLSKDKFEDIFFDLEVVLLENNAALEVVDKIKDDLEEKLVNQPLDRGAIEQTIKESLAASTREILQQTPFDFIAEAKAQKGPFILLAVGINGSGKTTTMAKIAHLCKANDLSVVLAAADTYRAAAIHQLESHAEKLDVKIIKHDYGSDPAAVGFDAVKHAEAKGIDVVLVDTAGRLHHNENLMAELSKIKRVINPHRTLFIGESITGNDCIQQAKLFDEKIGIDGIILSKADIDEMGGAALSISYVVKKPVLYLGMGQEYKDLKPFDPEIIVESLGLE